MSDCRRTKHPDQVSTFTGGFDDLLREHEEVTARQAAEARAQRSLSPEAPYRVPRAVRVQRRGEAPFVLPLYRDDTYVFGRDRGCDVVFADDSISRRHGSLEYQSEGRWCYRDLGSSNGSFHSEHLDPVEPVETADRIHPGRGYVVAAGESVILGNGAGRLSLLEELPQEIRERRSSTPRSSASAKLQADIALHASHRHPVLLLGETGTGKTWAARRIHEASGVQGAFEAVNCGALSSDLNSLKSELLGHKKGAFTGATSDREGKLQHAQNGTLFLDEVESLSPEAQAFLLDLLDGNGNFAPLGAPPAISVRRPTFKLIAASKKPLRQTGLREDLCNRLVRGGIILIPGLDQRSEDIPDLIETFCARVNAEHQMDVLFDPQAIRLLQAQPWPDNVRGLEGVVLLLADLAHARRNAHAGNATGLFRVVEPGPKKTERELPVVSLLPRRAVVTAADVREHLQAREIAFGEPAAETALWPPLPRPPSRLVDRDVQAPAAAGALKRPKEYTRDEVEAALAKHGGNLAQTARSLGMVVNTLKARMTELGIERRR